MRWDTHIVEVALLIIIILGLCVLFKDEIASLVAYMTGKMKSM